MEAHRAPRLSRNEIRSLKKTRARGMTNKGSVAPIVDAIATSRYLIDTSDSQKPPKVTIDTEKIKRAINRISLTGESHWRTRWVANPKKKMLMVPAIMRISVAMIVDSDTSAGFAITVDTDMHSMEADPRITPRIPDRFKAPFDPSFGHNTVPIPIKVIAIAIQDRKEGISPSQHRAIRAVMTCPIIKNTTIAIGPKSCNAAKNRVSATAIPKTPLKNK